MLSTLRLYWLICVKMQIWLWNFSQQSQIILPFPLVVQDHTEKQALQEEEWGQRRKELSEVWASWLNRRRPRPPQGAPPLAPLLSPFHCLSLPYSAFLNHTYLVAYMWAYMWVCSQRTPYGTWSVLPPWSSLGQTRVLRLAFALWAISPGPH